jgi:hypothetical protein
MNTQTLTAVYAGNTQIGYGIIITVAAFIASMMLTRALCPVKEDSEVLRFRIRFSLFAYIIMSALFAAYLGRFIHWYSHYESYGSLSAAFRTFEGNYHEAGLVTGAFIASFISSRIAGSKYKGKILSAAAAGIMLFMTLISLTSMFNECDRGKAVIEDPAYMCLPFSYPTLTSAGVSEYRTAVFFWKFMILALITVIAIAVCIKEQSALRTYVMYFCAMALLDSARYDASFLRSNGFVSLMQIVAGVFLLITTICLTGKLIANRRFKAGHLLYILAFLLGLSLTGYMEYYVQRHGNLYISCYAEMAVACLVMAVSVIGLHRGIIKNR